MTAVVFTAITPPKLNIRGFREELLDELKKEGATQRRLLARTTTGWNDRPKFESDISLTRSGAELRTYPTGSEDAVNHWIWTDQGTPPHTITARNAPALRFQAGYTPRTKVRKYTSGQSKRFGAWRRPVTVHHPGTTAREWSVDLSERRKKPFQQRMEAAMARAAQKAW
jgi:hypothetical protein